MYERCVLKAEQLWVEWGRRHHIICQPFSVLRQNKSKYDDEKLSNE